MTDQKLMLAVLFLLCQTGLSLFHPNFSFGVSTSAFQTEGAWISDGKAPSAWDNLAHIKGFIFDGTVPDISDNSYYLFDKDVQIMKENGIKHSRFSIAWSRIIPSGRYGDGNINQKGIDHYRQLLKLLTANGITPYVTLFHNDLPANLFIHNSGYTDQQFVQNFVFYAQTCFQNFGDLVQYWFTFNEPYQICVFDDYYPEDQNTKPYLIAHQILLAHAAAVKLYRSTYAPTQNGKIGIVLNSEYYFPKTTAASDVQAAQRYQTFQLDWFANPIFNRDYPDLMKQIVGNRLPVFTEAQLNDIQGSADFFAINHYFSYLTQSGDSNQKSTFQDDVNCVVTLDPSWPLTGFKWPIVPQGLHDLLAYIKKNFLSNSNKPIYITENGCSLEENTLSQGVNDYNRVLFLQEYLEAVDQAINEGINVQKYFVWSLLDNFEWGSGFSQRFGLVRVEFGDNPRRYPKKSLKWYAGLIKLVNQN